MPGLTMKAATAYKYKLFTGFVCRCAVDIFLQKARPEVLSLNLDEAWAVYGGANSVAMLQRYAGRVP